MINDLILKYLLGLASTYALPKVDAVVELDILKTRLSEYPRNEFVWLLHDKGSLLIPLYQGFDPNEAYLVLDNCNECVCFHIQTADFSIVKISRVFMEELLFMPPVLNARRPVASQVDAFIKDGIFRQKWGLYALSEFDMSNWDSLNQFFLKQNIQPMLSYLREASRRFNVEQLRLSRAG
ncbi:MAG: hypothetical protein EOO52_13745 [Gammaproteobacteria bacterium]|nr:MAG: hypothetical protein EOO52_13745 [Gammaproteobacteria bacterium]